MSLQNPAFSIQNSALTCCGTWTGDMIRRCIEAGLPEPEFQLKDGFVTILRRPSKAQAGTNSSAGRAQDEAQEAQVEAQEAQVELTSLETTLLQAASEAAQTGNELLIAAGYKSRTGNFKRAMEKLLAANLLAMTLPDKPRSKNQQYRATEKGRSLIQHLRGKREEK